MSSYINTFLGLLEVAARLPRMDKEIAKHYKLTRQQMYLIFLVHIQTTVGKSYRLSDYANLLNISSSTLTRNIDKLVQRKVIEKVRQPGSRIIQLKLLSSGQLYAVDISRYIEEHLSQSTRESINI